MRLKKALQNMILLYLIACGVIVSSHVIFKLVVGRFYEVTTIFWVTVGSSAFIAVGSLIFYSARPMTHTQFKKRLALHAILFVIGTIVLYASDIFQFSKAAHPLLESSISFLIICTGYGIIAFLLTRSDRDRVVTQEMNDALQRYQSRKRQNRKNF